MIAHAGKLWTVPEVAETVGRCESRIRQICLEHEIGIKASPNLRLLSDADVKKIRAVLVEKKS